MSETVIRLENKSKNKLKGEKIMNKNTSIVRLVIMGLVLIGITVMLLPDLWSYEGTLEKIAAPFIAIGFGIMCADIVWLYSKMHKLVHSIATYFFKSTSALSLYGVALKFGIWATIYCLPFGVIALWFTWFSKYMTKFSVITGSNILTVIAIFLVIPALLAVPMVFSDICHIRGFGFIEGVKRLFGKKTDGVAPEELEATIVEETEPETVAEAATGILVQTEFAKVTTEAMTKTADAKGSDEGSKAA